MTSDVNSKGETTAWVRNATVGWVAWSLAVMWLWPGPASALLLLAAFVLTPLTLALIADQETPRRDRRLRDAAWWLHLPAALALSGSYAFAPGYRSGLLAAPWLAITLLIACEGFLHLRATKAWTIPRLCFDLGKIYVLVGGCSIVLSRLGLRPLGFEAVIIHATAVHFHYAGFILPVLAGLAACACRDAQSTIAGIGVVVGVPLLAGCITLSAFGIRIPELLAASFLAAVGALVAWNQIRLAERAERWPARILFTLSGFSLASGMLLAVGYAIGAYFGLQGLDIPTMIQSHGIINALGFAFCGLLAWLVDHVSCSTRTSVASGRASGVEESRRQVLVHRQPPAPTLAPQRRRLSHWWSLDSA